MRRSYIDPDDAIPVRKGTSHLRYFVSLHAAQLGCRTIAPERIREHAASDRPVARSAAPPAMIAAMLAAVPITYPMLTPSLTQLSSATDSVETSLKWRNNRVLILSVQLCDS